VTSRIPTHGPAVGAADLTVEVCRVLASGAAPRAECAHVRPNAAFLLRSHAPERSMPPLLGLTTPSAVPPSHSTRVPMHLTQVPRG